MDETTLTQDQVNTKQKLDAACSCGSGKKYGYCHGGNETCWCNEGPANQSHYTPNNATTEDQMATAATEMPPIDPVISSRDDDDDGGDFMVE